MHLGAVKTVAGIAVILGSVIWSERIVIHNPPPGRVHVVYWEKWTDFEADAMRDVVDAFNASQDKIYVDYLSISGIENKTLMAVSGGDPPDVAGLYGQNVAQYADDDAILVLDDFCKQKGISADRYIPAFFKIGYYRNHIYSLPSAPASVALHYNKDMLAAAGIAEPPKTYEELDEDCDKLIKRDPRTNHIIQQGFMPAEPGWWNFAWGYWFGGKLWNGKDKITANSPENIRAFEWIQSFSKKYGTSEMQSFRGGFGAFNSPQNAFLDGQVAMEQQGVWMSNFISKHAPHLKWGAVPMPYPKDRPDLANLTVADEDVLVIPRGAKHPKEAFEFINFVESQKGMTILCLGQRKNSPLKEMPPEFYSKHPNPFIKLFSDLPKGPKTFSTPQMGIWPEYMAALSTAFDEVNLMQKTPKEALDDVQARMQPKLDESLERLRRRGVIK
ncbi:MAG TPA: ABC transporter substrate-binding protein [Fimbriimonas sp.]|nr:ABC transporter substrate-binding protein [Fimbriimonas sp.]